jgi:RNA polymerase sigma-70 factor (ECF subfamily)
MSHADRKTYHAPAPATDRQLVALVDEAKAWSPTAFEQLVTLFQEDIFRMVYYRTRSSMDAEDLTQEIFIQAFKNVSKLKAADRFRSWLFSIALNRVRDFYRKQRLRKIFGTLDDKEYGAEIPVETGAEPPALSNLVRRDFWKNVSAFLDKLSRMEREVFMLRFMDHLGIKEISQALGKNESTVKTHLYRGLRKFRTDHALVKLIEETTP